jgi:N-acyl homoserine lactone hydrolase
MYTITPQVVAVGPKREKSRFTYMHNFGQKIDIPYVSWLIQGNGITVLVDAGCSAEDYRTHIRPADRPLMLAGEQFADVVDVKPLEEHLRDRGLRFDDIDILIQTHLDWDHTMGTRRFKKSRILLQRAEWAKIPFHPLFKGTYAPKYIYEEISKLNLHLLEGDHTVAPGLEILYTPGHSPGGQSVVVETGQGPYVIAGMCTIRENFYPPADVLAHSEYRVIPAGMHIDPLVCYDSMLRILERGGERVLPFHDSSIMSMGTIR